MRKDECKKIRNVAKYIRVSSDRQAKTGDSLRAQLEDLEDYVAKHDDMITVDTYIDGGISGQKLERDDFQRLMEDVKTGSIDLIIFTKLDRWFRNLRHYLNVQATLEKYNVSWLATQQPYFDTQTAQGRAFVAQSMTWAELEAQTDSERILTVFENKVRNGEVISGRTPLGYSIVDKHLQPDDMAPVVQAIFEHYKNNGSLNATMMYLRDTFGIYRTDRTIKRLLQKEIYIGRYRDNHSYCTPIIDDDTFWDVQAMLSKNIPRSQRHQYLFSGILKCKECGRRMCSCQILVHGHKRKDGTFLRYKHNAYRCGGKYDLKLCDNTKQLYETRLERYLLDNLKQDIQQYVLSYEAGQKPKANNRAKRSAVQKKIDRLKDLYVNELISLDEYKLDKARYEEQMEEIPIETQPAKDLSYLKKLLDYDIDSMYGNLAFEEKRSFWRSLIKEITFDKDRVITVVLL